MTELIRDRVASLITTGLQAAQGEGALPEFEIPAIVVERPRQSEHGDYASPACLQLAKKALSRSTWANRNTPLADQEKSESQKGW